MKQLPFRGGGRPYRTRRQGLGALAGGAALAACGTPGLGSETRQPSKATCASQLEFYMPFAASTVQYQGFQAVGTAFAAGRSGCSIQQVSTGGGALGVAEKLTTAQAAGAPPALTVVTPAYARAWATRKLIAPVDDLFKREKLDGKDFPVSLWKPMGHGGKVWLMPLFVSADFILHWNKEHFRDAGLNPE
ncbi:MAG: extracellular solute-binding protein, partial [Chloroflexota bacterium]|nr:extracellular solute-binding protein [Chloroflexota bacterium]